MTGFIIYSSQQHDVCQALATSGPKPAEYSKYLGRVLHTIKIPIRQSQPIPWDEIRAFRPLSILPLSPTVPKVILRLPAASRQVDDVTNPPVSREAKRKYGEISLQPSHEDVGVKLEEVDVEMVCVLTTLNVSLPI
jgi:hypothetical protein